MKLSERIVSPASTCRERTVSLWKRRDSIPFPFCVFLDTYLYFLDHSPPPIFHCTTALTRNEKAHKTGYRPYIHSTIAICTVALSELGISISQSRHFRGNQSVVHLATELFVGFIFHCAPIFSWSLKSTPMLSFRKFTEWVSLYGADRSKPDCYSQVSHVTYLIDKCGSLQRRNMFATLHYRMKVLGLRCTRIEERFCCKAVSGMLKRLFDYKSLTFSTKIR